METIKWYLITGLIVVNIVGLVKLIEEYGFKEPILIFLAYPIVVGYLITYRVVDSLVARKLHKIDPDIAKTRTKFSTIRRFGVQPREYYKLSTKFKILIRKPKGEYN